MADEANKVPVLRFPEFSGEWGQKQISNVLARVSKPVGIKPNTQYQQIGIRSHGKGIFHKDLVSGKSLGNKRVFWVIENAFVVNIVFAWEHAVAKTTISERGMIASHRFPMYVEVSGTSCIGYITHYFLTKKGKHLLGLASPGGAGRNKTLGQKTFEDLKLILPAENEQIKIADFLTAVDEKIQLASEKKVLLEQYKKGVMQKIFSQSIRFKDDNGKAFPDWKEKTLGEIAKFSKGKAIAKSDIVTNGKFECIRYGELYTHYQEVITKVLSSTNIPERYLVYSEANDIIVPASGETQIDIATASCVMRSGVALGGDLNIIKTPENGVFLSYYLNNNSKYDIARLSQGISVVHIYAQHLKRLKLLLPHLDEQKKIADFLTSIDAKIAAVNNQFKQAEVFKKGLLQQMFV